MVTASEVIFLHYAGIGTMVGVLTLIPWVVFVIREKMSNSLKSWKVVLGVSILLLVSIQLFNILISCIIAWAQSSDYRAMTPLEYKTYLSKAIPEFQGTTSCSGEGLHYQGTYVSKGVKFGKPYQVSVPISVTHSEDYCNSGVYLSNVDDLRKLMQEGEVAALKKLEDNAIKSAYDKQITVKPRVTVNSGVPVQQPVQQLQATSAKPMNSEFVSKNISGQ